ncbi:hypothetical protein [Streptomyces sp. NRRL S-1022]|uniref:hypothetical protein n=1 Tax=Streptomyces sp. NRRL S-1022 TaxID=1463880 RepID=UPI0004C29AF6|nr:hypothetical protein [Streptomyces sp. NRRL S-1022]
MSDHEQRGRPRAIGGIHVFACSLHLANHPESARFWWGFAAGAGHGAAAYCLHLQHLLPSASAQHLTNGELREADVWWERVEDALADTEGDARNIGERTTLIY